MARDGNGGYSLPAGNPVVTGTTISSTVQNNTMNDVAAALTDSIASDGQTTPTADLKMGGFKHKNVANATSRISSNANYASAADVQDGTVTYLTAPAGTNTVTASAPLGLVAYVTGQRFQFIPAATNTGATTLNINSIGAKNIFYNGVACIGGELVIALPIEVIYDGTQFHILSNAAIERPAGILSNAKSANYTLVASDFGKVIPCTGTFTLSITAAATLGVGWWCFVRNVSTGAITIDPNASETVSIPGGPQTAGTTITLPYSGSVEGPYNVSGVLLWCDGTNFQVLATSETHGSVAFTGGGTFTVPAGVTALFITQAGGGGGGGGGSAGGAGVIGWGGFGGLGGVTVFRQKVATTPGTAVTVTIGAGGTSGAQSAGGGNGGTTTFGALVSTAGGTGGASIGSGTGFTATGLGGFGPPGGSGGGLSGAFGGIPSNSTGNTGSTAAANSASGGGGGSGGVAANGGAGGVGGSGYCIVEW